MRDAKIIDGKAFSEKLVTQVAAEVEVFARATGQVPGLAVVLVGENPASQVYVRNKSERTTAAGMRSIEHRLDRDTDEASLLALIETLNQDDMVDGILVQLPLPNQINADAVINAIRPDKDVDGFHVVNAGLLATGQESLVPCTPFGCLLLLRDQLGDLSGLQAIVVGRSNIVGKPMAQLLLGESCTVTIAHSRTKDLESLCQQADVVRVDLHIGLKLVEGHDLHHRGGALGGVAHGSGFEIEHDPAHRGAQGLVAEGHARLGKAAV